MYVGIISQHYVFLRNRLKHAQKQTFSQMFPKYQRKKIEKSKKKQPFKYIYDGNFST